MSDILFGQSYFLRFDPKLHAAMQPYPPLGTMYAASYMRNKGYDVQLFDAMLARSEQEWAEMLDRTAPAFAVIYEDNFNYLSKMCLLRMREAAYTMLKMAQTRDCTTIVCGSDATDRAEQYLAEGADYVILGEGEETLGELVDALSGRTGEKPEGILGVAYAHKSNANQPDYRRNSRRPDIKDLDSLPFPAWDLVDVEKYRRIWLDRHGYFSMNMVTTRGCPYHCNWCAKPIWGQRYNTRTPGNVVDELLWLKERYHPDHIWFADDIMGLKPGWWQQFAALVNEKGARTPFKCLSRADLLVRSKDEVDALSRSGCDIVWIGAESGSQKILNAMEKGTRIEQIEEATNRLKQVGVKVAYFLQFGYPGETMEDIELTLNMVRNNLPDDVGMSVSYPLPGTKFHENVKAQLGTKQNWVDSADLDMMYQGPFSTAFYRQLHVVLHKEFRSKRGWESVRSVLKHPRNLRARHIREVLAIFYRLGTLPIERLRLNRLSRLRTSSINTMPHMPQEDAAQPSPQTE